MKSKTFVDFVGSREQIRSSTLFTGLENKTQRANLYTQIARMRNAVGLMRCYRISSGKSFCGV